MLYLSFVILGRVRLSVLTLSSTGYIRQNIVELIRSSLRHLSSQLIMPSMPSVRGLYPFKFAYNMIQVMLCSYMCIEAGVRAYTAGYSLLPCNKFNSSEPPIAFILYVFYISKILDFLDTFFIIAEKRFKQLSFLHVYHHTSIFLVSRDVPHLSSPAASCNLTLTFSSLL
jgi:GNS1/SUR4 family